MRSAEHTTVVDHACVRSVVHIIRMASFGGACVSTTLQAAAEQHLGRRVTVWYQIAEQSREFLDRVRTVKVQALPVTSIGLCARLLLARLGGTSVIHLHSGRGCLSPRIKLIRRLLPQSIPLVVTLHGPSSLEPHGDRVWVQRHLANAAYVSAIIVPSEAEREVHTRIGIDPCTIFAVPNLVDVPAEADGSMPQEMRSKRGTKVVLYCGRLAPEKGVVQLLDAFDRVHRRHTAAQLFVAGDGPCLGECRRILAGSSGGVHLLGHVENVAELYREADVFVSPSRAESFGRSALDAAMAGVPMVLSRIPPWTDWFEHGVHCRYVDHTNASSIADGINGILDDPEGAGAMADRARAVVADRCDHSKVMTLLTKAYVHALRRCNVAVSCVV